MELENGREEKPPPRGGAGAGAGGATGKHNYSKWTLMSVLDERNRD